MHPKQDDRQRAFDAIWRAKKADGFGKTTAWEGSGLPLAGNGCLCCLEALSQAGNGLYFALTGDERLMLVSCHSRARSSAEMEAGLRTIAITLGVNVPDEDDGFAAFKAKVLEPVAVTA